MRVYWHRAGQAQTDPYTKEFPACLEGKGYPVK